MNHKSVIHQEKQHQDIQRALINTSGISPLRTLLDGQTGRLQTDHCPNGPCSVAGQRSESEWAGDGLAITVGVGGAGLTWTSDSRHGGWVRRRTSRWVRRSPWGLAGSAGATPPCDLGAQCGPGAVCLRVCVHEAASGWNYPSSLGMCPNDSSQMVPWGTQRTAACYERTAACYVAGRRSGLWEPPPEDTHHFLGSGFHDGRSSHWFYGIRPRHPGECGEGVLGPLEGTAPGSPVGLRSDLRTQPPSGGRPPHSRPGFRTFPESSPRVSGEFRSVPAERGFCPCVESLPCLQQQLTRLRKQTDVYHKVSQLHLHRRKERSHS